MTISDVSLLARHAILAIEDDRSGPPAAVYFALNMALYTEGGTVHGNPDLVAWVEEATGVAPTVVTLEGTPDAIAVAVDRVRPSR